MRKKYGKKLFFFSTTAVALSLVSCNSEKNTILTTPSAKNETTQTATTDETKLTIGKDGKVYVEYKDENNNGIPDELESLYAEKSTNEIFSITLGSAIAFVLNLIYLVYNITKTKKTNSSIKEMTKESVSFVEQFKTTASETNESTKALVKQNEALVERLDSSEKTNEEQTKEIKALKESNEALTKGYASINEQMNTILANQALMADTKDYTKTGANATIQKNVKEALKNGKEKDNS